MYGAAPFLLARSIPDLCLLRIAPSVCFGMILFEMLGLQQHTKGDFIWIMVLLSTVSSLSVIAISSLMPSQYEASVVSIFMNIFFMLYGGVFISTFPEWIEWPKQFSFYNFAFEILMVNEFTGLEFQIEEATISYKGMPINVNKDSGVTISGEFWIDFFGLNAENINHDWCMLFVWLALYFLIAWFALAFLHRSRR